MNTKTQFRDCFTDEAPIEEDYAEIDAALAAYENHLIHLCADSDCEFCRTEKPDGIDLQISLP